MSRLASLLSYLFLLPSFYDMGKTNVFAVWEKNLQLDGNVARDCLLLGILDEDRFGTT